MGTAACGGKGYVICHVRMRCFLYSFGYGATSTFWAPERLFFFTACRGGLSVPN